MSQIIKTKQFGPVEFGDKQWTMGTTTIGVLAGGGYAYLNGHMVESKDALIRCIPSGPDLAKALDWWENKDKIQPDEIQRRIVVLPDNSYAFEDGSPIESATDLLNYFGPGDALEAALRWFAKELVRREEVEQAKDTRAGDIARVLKAKPSAAKAAKQAAEAQAAPEVAVTD